MKKILFSDLDGTIIGKDGLPLHENNLIYLQKLRDEGHLVCLCTGRNNIDLLPTLKQVSIPYDYLVLCNGGYIVDDKGKVVYENDVPNDTAKALLSTIANQDLLTYFCDEEKCCFVHQGNTQWLDKEANIHEQKGKETFIEFYQEAKKFTILGINQEDFGTEILDALTKDVFPSYEKDISWSYNQSYIDIMGPGSTKGTGLLKLINILDIPYENTYAIGDSFNDIAMIQTAKHGYTFHHSDDVVKEKAEGLVDYLYELCDIILKSN